MRAGLAALGLATLLPLLRGAFQIGLLVVGGLIVLSELGINIGPLLAGAGVAGIAVGFGAQTLVRDIFSGVFFLIDDAFRVGEYIETGSSKVRLRRFQFVPLQLRHHGPLHTVSFKRWATHQLFPRLGDHETAAETDIRHDRRVRKLIKKLGQELQQHPRLATSFLSRSSRREFSIWMTLRSCPSQVQDPAR